MNYVTSLNVCSAPDCKRFLSALVLTMFVISTAPAASEHMFRHITKGDVPLSVTVQTQTSGNDELLAGYASGRLVRLSFEAEQAQVVWEAGLDGPVVATLVRRVHEQDDASILASTGRGQVACFVGPSTQPAWQFRSTCEVSSLAELPGADGQCTNILVGGADHRVHLLNGRNGELIWSRLLESEEGDTYINALLAGGDLDGDGAADAVAWMWSGELAAISGRTGDVIWRQKVNAGFTDALAPAGDLNGDGLPDFLVGGNEGKVSACSGGDGSTLWSAAVGRTVRSVAVDHTPGQGRCAYACTASGEVACIRLTGAGAEREPAWRASLGDVCRKVVTLEDADRDGINDVAACAENGTVVVLSGKTGRMLIRGQAGDVVRSMVPMEVNARRCLAVASLDGIVSMLPLIPASAGSEAALVRLYDKPEKTGEDPGRPEDRPAHRQRTARFRSNSDPSAGASKDPRVIILLYHDVVPELFYHYGISVETFTTHMHMLREEKYTCVSLDQIADWIEGKGGMPDRAVCITFDGPYAGHQLYAAPILRERGLFASSYITTDWIGTTNHADWHELREMDAAGLMDIQNHTINHPYLTHCDRTETLKQLQDCNQAISRHMPGKDSRHHAYPSGAQNAEVRGLLRESGFRTATTIVRRPVKPDDDLLALPRFMLCTHITLEQFRGWLTGAEAAATTGGPTR